MIDSNYCCLKMSPITEGSRSLVLWKHGYVEKLVFIFFFYVDTKYKLVYLTSKIFKTILKISFPATFLLFLGYLCKYIQWIIDCRFYVLYL